MAFSLKKTLKRSYYARFAAWFLVLNWVDLLAMIGPRRKRPRARKRVIFLKMDGIGDYLIWTSTFAALEKIYPSDKFERILVATDKTAELAKGQAFFEKRIFLEWDRFIVDPAYRFRSMRGIRGVGADILINPRLTREFLWSDSIVRCCGAEVRIGSVGIDNHMTLLQDRIGRSWYTKLLAPPQRNEHELVSQQNFVDALEPTKTHSLTLPIIDASSTFKSEIPRSNYAVFFLGASSPRKIFPIEKFVAVAEYVAREYGLQTVICGGPGEEILGEEFRKRFSQGVIDMIGRTTLGDLAAVIQGAKLVVANDTGAAHFAAGATVPTVVLTPGNHVGRFFPYPAIRSTAGIKQLSVLHEMPCFGCGWDCIYTDLPDGSPWPCIGQIGIDDIVHAIDELLSKQAGN